MSDVTIQDVFERFLPEYAESKNFSDRQYIAVKCIQAIAISGEEGVKFGDKRDSSCLIVGKHLSNKVGTIHAILISYIAAGKITIAFLKAKDVAIFFSLFFK